MSLKNGESFTKPMYTLLGTMITDMFPAAFPSSAAFDAINATLSSSDAERKDAMKQGNAVFAFTLKNKEGATESWHIDLRDEGKVGQGLGTKPNGKSLPYD
jgi:hypothetical protein